MFFCRYNAQRPFSNCQFGNQYSVIAWRFFNYACCRYVNSHVNLCGYMVLLKLCCRPSQCRLPLLHTTNRFCTLFLIDCYSWTGSIKTIPLFIHSFGSLWLSCYNYILRLILMEFTYSQHILKPLHTIHDYAVPDMWTSLVTTNWRYSISER